MVIFSDLRINDNKDKIFVDCYIEDLDAYEQMYIKDIYIYYYKNASTVDGTPLDYAKAFKLYDATVSGTGARAVSTTFTLAEMESVQNFGTSNFNGGLFYVMVTCDGTLGDTSGYAEGADATVDIGIILDWAMLYQKGMSYVSMFGQGNVCNFPQGYDLFLLLWFGLKLALETYDYARIAQLWEKFLRTMAFGGTNVLATGCGCH